MTRTPSPGLAALALLTAPALLLVACSGGAEEAASSSAAPSSSAAANSSAAPSPSGASPSGGTETILAVLCDEAAPESVAAIEAVMLPDFTVSQLVDVRTDDDGMHAILGFVEGPGLAVLAQWTGTGLTLEGLAAADEFAAQVTDVAQAAPDQATQDLLGQTVTCYSNIFAPEDGDKKKKKDKNAE
jgi:beta-N-acetylhexosaminidase